MSVLSQRAVAASFVLLLGSHTAFAQGLTVVSGNDASAEIFQILVGPEQSDQIIVLNSQEDQTDIVSPRSFVLYEHLTYTDTLPGMPGGLVEDKSSLYLLVADTLADTIWRYRPPIDGSGIWTRDSTPVWTDTIGPVGPDGLSLGQGFVSVVSATPNTNPAVYLLPTVVPSDNDPVLETGFGPPLLLDDDFSIAGVPLNVQAVEETVVSPVNVGPVGFGDVLVVVSDRTMVLKYDADDVAALLAGSIPENSLTPTVLLDLTQLGTDQISGIAFWPVDGSLLVARSGGDVLWFDYDVAIGDWVPHSPALFTSNQGQGKFRIRADFFNGVPYAIVANLRGEVLVFEEPASTGGANDPVKRITDGVQSPHGIVVTDFAALDATCLGSEFGCDPLSSGAESPVFISRYIGNDPPEFSGSLTEQTCRVNFDPRLADDGVCTSDEVLYLDEVCPEFATDPERVAISWEVCGVYDFGANGIFDDPDDATVAPEDRDTNHGFAVIEASLTSFEQQTDQMFVRVLGDSLLGPGVEIPCPREAIGWSAIPGEEQPIVAGFTAIDVIGGCNSPGETRGRTLSFWFLGQDPKPPLGDPSIDPVKKEDLWPLWRDSLSEKFSRLFDEIDDARGDLVPLSRPEASAYDETRDCVVRAERDALRGSRRALGNAATRIIQCDELVKLFETNFGYAKNAKNPYGTIRMMLLHLYFVIQQRILDEPPSPTAFDGFYSEVGQ